SKRAFLYLIPLFIIKNIFDRKEKGLYGLKLGNFNLRPYFIMLLIMLPLIGWASFQSDFLNTYPKLRLWGMEEVFNLNRWQMTGVFEFFYGTDFIFVELIFRGALVVGLVKILGKDAILPMVAAYSFLHFGKPLAEAISSIFGGYILGVIALYSKNILGGCVIHIGIAYLMELFAILQYYVFISY
ncbi:MAG: CPBP family glutamic-type intramembrane protease, partial [Bacteroidota bacterium]